AALRARRFGLSRLPRPPTPTLFPYTTLFRSAAAARRVDRDDPAAEPPTSEVRAPRVIPFEDAPRDDDARAGATDVSWTDVFWARSEEHTSELQSRENLVCRLLLEKKKTVMSN